MSLPRPAARRLRSLLFICVVLAPAAARAASVTLRPGQTLDLTADLVLGGGDTLDAAGTAERPCTIAGHGHRIVGRDLTGRFKIDHCMVVGAGGPDEAAAAIDVTASGSAEVAIADTVFDRSGSVRLHLGGQATAHVTGCVFRETGVTFMQDELAGSRYVAAFHADGTSTGAKTFQGNRVLRSSATFDGVSNWLIGGWGDRFSNVVVGHRGVISVRGDHVKVVGNFINPQYPLKSPDVENLVVNGPDDAHDLLVEHNVLRSGEWVMRACRGEVRYNVVADMNGHAWIKGPTDCNVHHNVFVNYDNPDHNAEGGIDVVYLARELRIYNNTFDGGGTIGRLGVPAVHVKRGRVVDRLHSNAFTSFIVPKPWAIVGNLGPDSYDDNPPPGDARAHHADYNLFWNPGSPSQTDYTIAVQPDDKTSLAKGSDGFGKHDVHADPAFAGPLPTAFPFESEDVVAGKVTVSTILERYRALYTPGPGSPLVGAGDPSGGPSNNIGAVGQGAEKDPADRFGTFQPGPRAKGAGLEAATTGGCGCTGARSSGALAMLLAFVGLARFRRPDRTGRSLTSPLEPGPPRAGSWGRTTRG